MSVGNTMQRNKSFSNNNNKMHLVSSKLLTKSTNITKISKLLNSNAITGVKFENTLNLPYLPIPKLSQTFEKFFITAQPFLNNNNELETTKKLINNFQNGIGMKLQDLLVKKAQNTENWLADWWLDCAYLSYRDPVVVYTSPGQLFMLEDFQNEQQRIEFTAQLILAALDYKSLIESDGMPIDKMGKDSLDMNQYKKIFGTCRIPGVMKDSLQFNPNSKHIVIIKNNQYFKMNVINSNGEIPSMFEIMSYLESIFSQTEDLDSPIGILTTENRNNWGTMYEYLIKNPVNKKSVDIIQKSLFVVCLDNPMPNFGTMNRLSEASHQLIHGGGSRGNSGNRWFDKTVQFVVGEDGIVGLTYEHSPSEGQPIAVMTDYLYNYIKTKKAKNLADTKFDLQPEKLPFIIDDQLEKYIDQAKRNVDKLVSNLEMSSFKFDHFGKEFVKLQKLSPDSFIQMALQLAFYRIHNVPGAQYESAATRKYIHGRTETIRSCSNESINFVKTFLNPTKTPNEKIQALKLAINRHKKYSLEAVNGFGVDRHLLGLKLIAIENKLEIPELFTDPSFTRSNYWRVSTSQVATNCDGFMCYGPAVVDGYGCCYNPRKNDINFAVSAFVENPQTSAKQFHKALEQSLIEMHDVLAKFQNSKL